MKILSSYCLQYRNIVHKDLKLLPQLLSNKDKLYSLSLLRSIGGLSSINGKNNNNGKNITGFQNSSGTLVRKLFEGLLKGNRACLAESITLVETSNLNKKTQAKQLLTNVLLHQKKLSKRKKSFRVGLSGPPGAGKSTFIEYLGKYLTKNGLKIAVLAIDPSSATSGGSILGDKTRMPELSRDMKAYIRPSPTRGHLGGVTRSTNEAIILCEAAGYDVIIVETVGVGQSEFSVSDMVDMFALIIPPGAGDELQGIKKGIMELSDIIIVNKADGDLVPAARRVQYEYMSALKFVPKRNKQWKPKVLCVSSLHGVGIEELWTTMTKYKTLMEDLGIFDLKRREQQISWMWTHLKDNMMSAFLESSSIKREIKIMEKKVFNEEISPGDGADSILKSIIKEIKE